MNLTNKIMKKIIVLGILLLIASCDLAEYCITSDTGEIIKVKRVKKGGYIIFTEFENGIVAIKTDSLFQVGDSIIITKK